MKTFTWQYPGDPPDLCKVMSGGEFKFLNPNRFMQVISSGVVSETFPITDAICDLCSKKIGDTDRCYLAYKDTRLYCEDCAGISILPNKKKKNHDSNPN